MFVISPVIDSVIAVIDGRIQTTAFNAEQALTRDTVPVKVDTIVFWHVQDAERAALAIAHYREAIDRVAQTSAPRDDRHRRCYENMPSCWTSGLRIGSSGQ